MTLTNRLLATPMLLGVSLLCMSTFLASCGSDAGSGNGGNLRKSISAVLKDCEIEVSEWAALADSAKGSAYSDCAKLTELVKDLSKRRCPDIKIPACGSTGDEHHSSSNSETKNFSLLIENSNSMMGYFIGATEFKEALMAIPSRVQETGGKFKFYFITEKPKEIGSDYKTFIEKLDKESAKYRDKNLSLLDQLIAQASDIAVKEKRITILASDFIYDVGNKKPQDVLPKLQYAITDQIQKYKKSGDYGVLVLKMSSAYSGSYFSYNGKATPINEKRPYYIWLFGPTKQLVDLFRSLNFENLKGFEEYAFFYESGSSKAYYSILPQTNNKGNFIREKKSGTQIHKITDAKVDGHNNLLQFSLAVDLTEIPTPAAYLLNQKNYELSSDKNDVFEIVDIKPIKDLKLHNNDEKYKGSATHVLTFKTSKVTADAQTLKLRLLKQMPDWIEKSSSDDDVNIKSQLNKTFGLKYVMEGLINGYILAGTKPAYIQFEIGVAK